MGRQTGHACLRTSVSDVTGTRGHGTIVAPLVASAATSKRFRETAGSGSLGFGYVRGDRIHQRWRQAIIGLEPKLLEARPDPRHLVGLDAGLDHRRYERRKSRSRRTLFLEQFGMDEVETVERVSLVLDAAIHMGAAGLAGVPLDRRRGIDDVKLVAVFKYGQAFARDHGDHGKNRPLRLPAFGATTGVVVGDVALDGDFDRPVLAFADQRSAGKVTGSSLYAAVD
jgi:hypothetical protein